MWRDDRTAGAGYAALLIAGPAFLGLLPRDLPAPWLAAATAAGTWAVLGSRSLSAEADAVAAHLRQGDLPAARHYFQLVWTIDRSYVSAGFGTARAYLASGDRVSAIAAVAAVPETSSHHAAAQIAAVRLLVASGAGQSVADLHQADQRLVRLSLDDNDPRRHLLSVEILRAALDWVSDGTATAQRAGPQSAAERILGYEPNERALRFGLERGYRALATLMPERRVELVDMANSVRPRTWI